MELLALIAIIPASIIPFWMLKQSSKVDYGRKPVRRLQRTHNGFIWS